MELAEQGVDHAGGNSETRFAQRLPIEVILIDRIHRRRVVRCTRVLFRHLKQKGHKVLHVTLNLNVYIEVNNVFCT